MTDTQQQDDLASAENHQQELEQQEKEVLAKNKERNKRMIEAFSSD
jgi:hypothetical protein